MPKFKISLDLVLVGFTSVHSVWSCSFKAAAMSSVSVRLPYQWCMRCDLLKSSDVMFLFDGLKHSYLNNGLQRASCFIPW